MMVVIFESVPHPDRGEAYLDAAARLRPLLSEVDGFISIERFTSLSQPGRILSLSYWRDEASIERWRNLEAHRQCRLPVGLRSSRTIDCVSRRSCATTA